MSPSGIDRCKYNRVHPLCRKVVGSQAIERHVLPSAASLPLSLFRPLFRSLFDVALTRRCFALNESEMVGGKLRSGLNWFSGSFGTLTSGTFRCWMGKLSRKSPGLCY
jgi:hypothetical protein